LPLAEKDTSMMIQTLRTDLQAESHARSQATEQIRTLKAELASRVAGVGVAPRCPLPFDCVADRGVDLPALLRWRLSLHPNTSANHIGHNAAKRLLRVAVISNQLP
jgi:hypothetical protein